MMEESGIETTPPGTPPPITMAMSTGTAPSVATPIPPGRSVTEYVGCAFRHEH